MQWYPLSPRDSGLLIAIFVVTGIFARIQQYFIPAEIRPFSYLLVVFLFLAGFFFIVKPQHPFELGKFLAVLLGAIVALIFIVRDILIIQNYSSTLTIVFVGAVLLPLIAAFLYSLVRKIVPCV
jgi:hypothetical protein